MKIDNSSCVSRHRGCRRLRGVVAITALVPVAALPSITQASTASDHDPIYVACMRGASSTPDSLEHSAGRCADTAADASPRYIACMRSASGSPDSLEHWVDWCVGAALGQAAR